MLLWAKPKLSFFNILFFLTFGSFQSSTFQVPWFQQVPNEYKQYLRDLVSLVKSSSFYPYYYGYYYYYLIGNNEY